MKQPSEHNSSTNLSGVLTLLLDSDDIAELAGLAVNLDAVVEKLLKSGEVEDRIVHGNGAVDVELVKRLAGGSVLSGGGSFRLFEHKTR